jgi:YidC/Oxa1 family membrane protein insertase
MLAIWDAIKDFLTSGLSGIHDVFVPLFGTHSWGWAIIVLTVIIRLFMVPLAVKQIRSMRAMQELQPKIKQLQKKHKVDRDLMRKDPETYRSRKQKLNEEMMALYKQEGVNPAGGCLPLLLQAPVFLALFQVLRDFEPIKNAQFYFFTSTIAEGNERGDGLGAFVSDVGWPGWLLILLMAGTMFWSQRQMLARNAASAEGAMAQQQKIMMYVMPVFLGAISFNFPLGVLLYWVTTNLWQMGQQAVMLREVSHELEERTEPPPAGGKGGKPRQPGDGGSGGRASKGGSRSDAKGRGTGEGKGRGTGGAKGRGTGEGKGRGTGEGKGRGTGGAKGGGRETPGGGGDRGPAQGDAGRGRGRQGTRSAASKDKTSGAAGTGTTKGSPGGDGSGNGQANRRKREHLPGRGDGASR